MHFSQASVALIIQLTIWHFKAPQKLPDKSIVPVHDREYAGIRWKSGPIRSNNVQVSRIGVRASLANHVALVPTIDQSLTFFLEIHGEQLNIDAVNLLYSSPEGKDLRKLIVTFQMHYLHLLEAFFMRYLPFLEIKVEQVEQDCAVFASVEAEHDVTYIE